MLEKLQHFARNIFGSSAKAEQPSQLSAPTQFYAYIHCKPDGMPFYVGKGKNGRSNQFYRRSLHHKNIVAKHGKENIAVWKFDCDSEQKAFDLEIYLIAHYKRAGFELCNLTNGGEGISGMKRSAETCAKISAKIISIETRAILSAKARARLPISDETRARMSVSGKNRLPCSKETRMKLSIREQSIETRMKRSVSVAAAWARRRVNNV